MGTSTSPNGGTAINTMIQHRRNALIATGLMAITACSSPSDEQADTESIDASAAVTYTNGYWYTTRGPQTGFTLGERYIDGDRFVAEPIAGARRVDLGGAFVVPPFGEAHNHSVDGPGTERTAQRYIEQGVFYYKNPNSIFAFTEPLLDYWRRTDTLDVSFSFGGLSRDEGHPEKLYRMLIDYGLYKDFDADELDGQAFFDVATDAKLDARWPAIIGNKPDFLKLYLLEHDTDTSDGLPETLFREIVARAKKAGLRTSVHVETVQDLALAVDAGANEAAHLPAYNLNLAKDSASAVIPNALIEIMAAQQFAVIATVNVSQGRDYAADDLQLVMDRQADNLRRLHEAGVPIAIGSDSYFQTAWDEIQSLKRLGIFNDATLTRLWIETPALSIFPERKIGRLAPDYEASFLVLECNPLDDIACTQSISLGVKQGNTLIAPKLSPSGTTAAAD
ncbi:MAG: amidohydrolase family protein [Pseudomonadota bacterium]